MLLCDLVKISSLTGGDLYIGRFNGPLVGNLSGWGLKSPLYPYISPMGLYNYR